MGRHPLFDIKFQLLNVPPVMKPALHGVEIAHEPYDNVRAQVDISLDVRSTCHPAHFERALVLAPPRVNQRDASAKSRGTVPLFP